MLIGKTKFNKMMMSVALIACCECSATVTELVDIWVEVDGWTMMPIAENGATTHIIAVRNDDEALTTDIDVVLYEKTEGGWSGWAYDPIVSKEDAMIDLAEEFGLADPFSSGEWPIELDVEDVLDNVLPRVGFGKGFFVTDPLYEVAHQIDNPEPLAEAAESSGMAAGSGAVNTGGVPGGSQAGPAISDGCGCDACLQDGFSSLVDVYLQDPDADIDQAVVDTGFEASFSCPCYYRLSIPGPSTVWSPWVCGAWTVSHNAATGICTYSTNSSRSRSRTVTTRCFSCISGYSSFTWTQFQNQSGPVTVRGSENANGTCPPMTSCPAPLDWDYVFFWTPLTGPGCPRP